MRMGAGIGGGRGNLRAAKTPSLQAALRGGGCGVMAPPDIYAIARISTTNPCIL